MSTLTIDEIKDVLKKKHGFDGRELRSKTEEQLTALLQQAEADVDSTKEIDFGNLEVVDDQVEIEDQIKESVSTSHPLPGSESWHEHVMKMFFQCEVTDGHPNVEGLRRVAQLISSL